ncbi:MAG: molybdopterin-dependent oxidoreductase [Gammaproteobacteria bacterium]|nr:molybdopterin-dependent oxidoreductase [Gammaproteobacteria bacterium]
MKVLHPTSHHWGSGEAEVENGVLNRVHPHPGDPDPSRINDNVHDGVYGSSRVMRPAVRKSYLEQGPGAFTERRGEEQFVEVSWDKALSLIASELSRIPDQYGNEAIFAGSYGWASAGRFHHAQSQLKRFLNSIGGFVRSEGNYSYQAALVLMPHIVGNFRKHVREATRWSTVATEGRLVVMFGGMPLRNVQVSGGGIGKHRLKHDLLKCVEAGVKFINFSPLKGDADEALQAEWLPPRPGSDTAIMMGLAHTLLVENLHDTSFLQKYTVGFDRVSAYLLGQKDGVPKDANWAERQSTISAYRIRKLAREMANQRTLITTAVSLQRAEHGEQPLWMTVTLAAMLGQVGLAGGGYGIGYGADASIGTVDRPIQWPSFPQGENPITNFIPVACVTEMLLHPKESYQFDGKTMEYPDIRMVWWAGGNPFHHHQDLNRLRLAFQRPETIIVNEIGWTATARHADIVLPVATAMERTDFAAGNQDNSVVPMPKHINPVGETKEEYEIYCELEKRLGVFPCFSDGRSTQQWLAHLWGQLRQSADELDYSLPDLDTFLKGDILHFDDPEPNAVFLSAFRNDPKGCSLPTPSGLIELFSEVIEKYDYQDCPGQATWLPPREWLGAALAEHYPLHLISGQPETRLHSQYDNGEFSKSRKIKGREPVLIHPMNAARRHIHSGDIVRIFNDRGSCLAGAVLTESVREDVIFLWTGAWYDPDFSEPDQRDNHGNPNVLTHDKRTSHLSQGPAAQSALVNIEKFSSSLPPVRAFHPPIVPEKNVMEEK